MKSKILYLAVAAICCGYLPADAQESGYDYSADGIYYRILADSENCVEVAYGDENAPETIVIPSTVPINGKEYTVIGLGDGSLVKCYESKYLVLPPTLRYIDKGACFYLELSHVNFPENLEFIGNSAFSNCYLNSIIVPDKVSRIEYHAFVSCYFAHTMVLGRGVKTLAHRIIYVRGYGQKKMDGRRIHT